MTKIRLTLIFVLLLSINAYSFNYGSEMILQNALATFGAIGIALSVVISWDRNRSIGLGILHGFLSWTYILYLLIRGNFSKASGRREFNLNRKRQSRRS